MFSVFSFVFASIFALLSYLRLVFNFFIFRFQLWLLYLVGWLILRILSSFILLWPFFQRSALFGEWP